MLPAFKGRINRKTFVLGNAVGLGLLGFAALIYILPIAVIDILVSKPGGSSPVFKTLYFLFAIPVLFYLFFGAVLFCEKNARYWLSWSADALDIYYHAGRFATG